jgi:hypothetical protein
MDSMKISELIKSLRELKKKFGDVPVLLSSDEEGNSYGTISEDSFGRDATEKYIIIYPWRDYPNL